MTATPIGVSVQVDWKFASVTLQNSYDIHFQYEPGVLEACLKLLQVSPQHLRDGKQDYLLRADPVYLSRVLCAMVRPRNQPKKFNKLNPVKTCRPV